VHPSAPLVPSASPPTRSVAARKPTAGQRAGDARAGPGRYLLFAVLLCVVARCDRVTEGRVPRPLDQRWVATREAAIRGGAVPVLESRSLLILTTDCAFGVAPPGPNSAHFIFDPILTRHPRAASFRHVVRQVRSTP
jgi:hypothetical protein